MPRKQVSGEKRGIPQSIGFELDDKSRNPDATSGRPDAKSGNPDAKSGSLYAKSGNPVAKIRES